MPRLTDATYLDQRQRLMVIWDFRSSLFMELESFEQRSLHRFFAMRREMYDEDALAYRREVTKQTPSLPSQAGRAYAHLLRVLSEDKIRRSLPPQPRRVTSRIKPSNRTITIKTLARPEIDLTRLTRVLVEITKLPNFDELVEKVKAGKNKR